LWEINKESKMNEVFLKTNCNIKSMSLSPNEKEIVIALDNNTIVLSNMSYYNYCKNLKHDDPIK